MQELIRSQVKPEIQVFANAEALTQAAAAEFVQQAHQAIQARGRFTIALSGGSTPKSLYALLATQPWRNQIPWNQIHFFWGDERHVPPSDPSNNFRMTQEQLLFQVPIPQENVYRIKAENPDAKAAAAEYEQDLRQFFQLQEHQFPRFDLVLLGMGANGHTASLFPGTDAVHEQTRLVVAPWVEELNSYRITLTPPVINNAVEILFFVTGAEKATTLKAVLEGQYQPDRLPAQIISPTQGRVMWMIDQAAAHLLET
ncbi:6-phosphogluconolactonase [Brasilonema octagenarum UFV-E1]|uniref:6-phosphogluconolactonase n=1 Tax=Brasilonema sennae CENA114 TaxID=415709 RepID=A0A856M7G8_9CYAN|nr:6-phosphogluconolactonase [Brasilonema sennae]QDL06768.1 6-phosphogluconolactonase [Brasilonema sennae CENA114]QDL13137.1 6-phosphogluconolactonase [Brasilonema octagenarum UFV-E1]